MNKKYLALWAALLTLSACGPAVPKLEEPCAEGATCSEADLNAPVPGSEEEEVPPPTPPVRAPATLYQFPAFKSSWGFPRRMYDKTVFYYANNQNAIANKRYVIIVDFRQHSSKKRFYLFDLEKGTVEQHAVTHGRNSDPDNDGYATEFSNTENSLQSSLGFYLTLATYQGKYGHSLRLDGKEATNSNAYKRAIVMHPADYASDDPTYAGRSWGCPALDPRISTDVINKVKNGALMLIDR